MSTVLYLHVYFVCQEPFSIVGGDVQKAPVFCLLRSCLQGDKLAANLRQAVADEQVAQQMFYLDKTCGKKLLIV